MGWIRKFNNKTELTMDITYTSLEALILKATHESLQAPDNAAITAFCAVLRDATDGPQLATRALASRIQKSKPHEAMLTLVMLDRCMRRSNHHFVIEVGKFRFLNEMIKLVSPKYLADRTAPEVRCRILQLLHAWAIEYPRETKFKVAYDMLINQGVVKETPPPLPVDEPLSSIRARAKNAIYEDEEKSKLLQKLLQSKKPEDLQHANRLIKTMVREEERRNEACSRRLQEVCNALDSAGLLRELLDHASDASADEEQLIHELASSCHRLRQQLQRLASEPHQDSALDDILNANDALDEVFYKYNRFMAAKMQKSKTVKPETNGDSLLDFAGEDITRKEISKETNKDTLDELGDIFSTESSDSNIIKPLKPVNLVNEDLDLLEHDKNVKTEAWNELDSLGEQLLKQSLPDNSRRLDGFASKSAKKLPMNALEKPTSPQKDSDTNLLSNAILDLDFFTKKPEDTDKANTVTSPDVLMLDISLDSKSDVKPNDINTSPLRDLDSILDLTVQEENATRIPTPSDVEETEKKTIKDVKSLTDLIVTLESVKPSKVPPLTAFDEGGLSVTLHFGKDRPRPDVNVIVVSTTSKNTSPIEDYKFQAVIPKGCKVRLLPASGTSLPAYNPFLPPPALTQLMLVARPMATPISLKFVITYICDEETCSEMGEVSNLPLDDI